MYACLQGQQQAQPQWQQQAVVAEGEGHELWGTVQEAQQQGRTVAQAERVHLKARLRELEACKPRGQVQEQQWATGTGTGQGMQYLCGATEAWW